jgi:hypothetical protein
VHTPVGPLVYDRVKVIRSVFHFNDFLSLILYYKILGYLPGVWRRMITHGSHYLCHRFVFAPWKNPTFCLTPSSHLFLLRLTQYQLLPSGLRLFFLSGG